MNTKDREQDLRRLRKNAEIIDESADTDIQDGVFGKPVELHLKSALLSLHKGIEKKLKVVLQNLGYSPKHNHEIEELQEQLKKLGENPPLFDQLPETVTQIRTWEYQTRPPSEKEIQQEKYKEMRELALETKKWADKRVHEIKAARNLAKMKFEEAKNVPGPKPEKEPGFPSPEGPGRDPGIGD